MFKNYLRVAIRNLLKNKVLSFINIFGLSIAIGCSVVVFLFIQAQLTKDTFHENAEEIFLVESVIERNGSRQVWGDTPVPLGPALKENLPQIKRFVRVADRGCVIRYEDKLFDESVRFVDPEFLEMFTFPLHKGNKDVLEDNNAVVFTEELAAKYFGDENPIGERVTMIFDNKYTLDFVVKGVAEKIPDNASFGFRILAAYEKQKDIGVERFTDWSKFTRATFIQLKDPNAISSIASQTGGYLEIQNAANTDRPVSEFVFDNLLNLSMNSHNVRGDISYGEGPESIIGMTTVGVILLLLACFNYMNIAVASATRRLKEIGVRKVVGGTKFQLIYQFLGENLLLCLLAMTLGIFLAEVFLLPSLNSMFPAAHFELDFFGNIGFWLYLPLLLLFTALAAGAYPAFFVSSFQPVHILAGKQRIAGRNLFTRILLTFQFAFCFIAIVASVVFTQNAEYQRNRDWGYNQDQTIVVPFDSKRHFTMYKNEISQKPDILHIAGSRNHIGESSSLAIIDHAGTKHEVRMFDVGFDYIETMGLRLRKGRVFDRKLSTDLDQAIVVNETFIEYMDWEDGIGKQITYDSTYYSIIGVVEDFHHYGFWKKIEPTILRLTTEENFNYLSVRVKAGSVIQTADFLRASWEKLIPDVTYKGLFQDQIFDHIYYENEGIKKVWMFVAFITLVISCMGLFGLLSLNITKRMKEISMHKVLGAGTLRVANLITKKYLYMMVIAIFVALPLSYFALNGLLDTIYEYHVSIGLLPFVLATVLIFMTAILVISSQVYKAVVVNPIESLRTE